jgi:hypothetical protein
LDQLDTIRDKPPTPEDALFEKFLLFIEAESGVFQDSAF